MPDRADTAAQQNPALHPVVDASPVEQSDSVRARRVHRYFGKRQTHVHRARTRLHRVRDRPRPCHPRAHRCRDTRRHRDLPTQRTRAGTVSFHGSRLGPGHASIAAIRPACLLSNCARGARSCSMRPPRGCARERTAAPQVSAVDSRLDVRRRRPACAACTSVCGAGTNASHTVSGRAPCTRTRVLSDSIPT